MTKRQKILQAYEELAARGGELPTARQVSQAAGATPKHVRTELARVGRPLRHMHDNTAAIKEHARRREMRDEEFRRKHESMTRSAGRYPTRAEMCAALGYRAHSSHVSKVVKRLDLPMTDERQKIVQAPVTVMQPPQTKPPYAFGQRTEPGMCRIREIRQSSGMGEGSGWGCRAGEGHAPQDRIAITCPVCGTRRVISPLEHPFWLRDAAGKVVFVCSRPCTGQAIW